MSVPRPTIDPKIGRLVDALNAFAGVHTLGSCGGHPGPLKRGQWPEGSWYVTFVVDKSEKGWFALEFLAWAINHDYQRAGYNVTLYPDAPPPYLNGPGAVLRFALEGNEGANPDDLASQLAKLKRAYFISPARAKRSPSPLWR